MDELEYSLSDPSEPAQIGRLARGDQAYRGSDNSNQAGGTPTPVGTWPKCYEAQNDWNSPTLGLAAAVVPLRPRGDQLLRNRARAPHASRGRTRRTGAT